MPEVLDQEIYNAVHEATRKVLKLNYMSNPLYEIKPAHSSAYRYSGYSNQPAENVNKVWTKLDNDKWNRWTGSSLEKDKGHQGLYLTAEADGKENTNFLELEHYQPKTDANDSISYLQGKDSDWRAAKASEMYTMFMFTTNKDTKGFNLTYKDKGKEFIDKVWQEAKSVDPGLFYKSPYDTMSATDWYNNNKDASFDRAMGNAVLEYTDVDYFRTDSVRNEYNREAENIVMRAESGKGVDVLNAQGRITFLTDKDGKNAQAIYTVDDLIYNDKFDAKFDAKDKINASLTQEELEYVNGVKEEKKKIETAINKVENDEKPDWSFAGNEVDTLIDGKIKEAITKQNIDLTADDFDMDATVKSLTGDSDLKLETNIRTHLDNYMWMNLGDELQQNDDLKAIDKDGIKGLAEYVVVQPKYDLIKDKKYISEVVKKTVINERYRKLIESSTTLQNEATECQQKIEDNNLQKDNIEKELKDLQNEMGNDPDQNQLDQKDKLDKELKELEDKNKDLEKEAKSKEDQTDKEMKDANDLDQQKEEAEKAREKSHGEIFK